MSIFHFLPFEWRIHLNQSQFIRPKSIKLLIFLFCYVRQVQNHIILPYQLLLKPIHLIPQHSNLRNIYCLYLFRFLSHHHRQLTPQYGYFIHFWLILKTQILNFLLAILNLLLIPNQLIRQFITLCLQFLNLQSRPYLWLPIQHCFRLLMNNTWFCGR